MLYYNVLSTTPVTLISLRGRFDSSGALVFEENFKKNESLYPVINFREVQFLSSAGIRVLLHAEKSLRSKNGKIIFSSVPASIRQVLEITGLLQQFTLSDSDENALQLQFKMQESINTKFNQVIDNNNYTVTRLNAAPQQVDIWEPEQSDNDNLIAVNLAEFSYAIGTGGLGNTRNDVKNMHGRVLLVNNFIGVLPDYEPADYLFSKNPSDTFFYINSAVNIAGSPNLVVDVMTGNALTYKKLMDNLFAVISDSFDNPAPAAGFLLIADYGLSEGMLTIGFLSDRMNENIPAAIKKEEVHTDNNLFLTSLGLKLRSNTDLFPNDDINDCINAVLQENNISEVIVPSGNTKISSAKIWVFIPEFKDARQTRLKISLEDSVKLSDEFEIITRRIYSDCSSIKLQQLHGGFSAKTFQVFGNDKRGIRILPTVLKLAKRSTVEREVNNYEENVKKYILNNSTSVMGSFFYGNSGGVRYNFVGITGPDSRICWLTNYYKEKPAEELMPIFDKVFTDILRPWYGQPRLETFSAYKEHNPTKVFFPELFEKSEEELGISADVERIYMDELQREIINPYWFLKYGYKERENKSRLWYKCICHGDLNMQNILLDEIKNIYIIDYSETSLRNAVADFARLEPIFKFEFPLINSEELKNLVKFEEGLLCTGRLDELPPFTYTGTDPFIEKAYKMIIRLRQYAKVVTLFENDLIPYLLAVLEWTYSVVCYQSVDRTIKKYSAISAALICEKILQLEKN